MSLAVPKISKARNQKRKASYPLNAILCTGDREKQLEKNGTRNAVTVPKAWPLRSGAKPKSRDSFG